MLSLAFPWILLLLPLPLLVYWLAPRARQQQAAVRVPFFNAVSGLEHARSGASSRRFLRLAG